MLLVILKLLIVYQHLDVLRRNCSMAELLEGGISGCQNMGVKIAL